MRAKLGLRLLAWAALLPVLAAPAGEPSGGSATLGLVPREATVGDPIHATLVVDLPPGARLDPPDLGQSLGRFSVGAARWTGPAAQPAGGVRWTWSATLTAFETGTLEVPALEIPFVAAGAAGTARSEPQSVTIRSVLTSQEQEAEKGAQPEIRDLKPEISVAPNFGPLRKALAALLGLVAVSAVVWWLHRRYAARFAAVPAPADPFGRMPPHAWAYQELQRLLEQRLPESGKIELFYSELARILKLYLGGRYRVDLMEHTTQEVVPLLGQAGAPAGPLLTCRGLLESCDLVKFARLLPPLEACRTAVEEAYRIVDVTKPVEEAPAEGQPAERGAA